MVPLMAEKESRRARLGIAGKWMISSFGVVLVILLFVIAAAGVMLHSYYYGAARQILLARSDYLYSMMEQYAGGSLTGSFDADLRHYIETFPDKARIELMAVDADGAVPITSSGFAYTPASLPDYQAALVSEDGSGWWEGEMGGQKVMAVCRLVPVLGSRYAAVRFVVSLENVDRRIIELVLLTAGAGAILLLCVLIYGILFTRSIVRPVREIGRAASRIAGGDFGTRVSRRAKDELGELCGTVNAMADALERSEQLKNEFISSVSHELRTPLTAIQGWAETLRDAAGDGEITQDEMELVQKGIQVIAGETHRLSDMVEELLDFSRMENGRLKMEMERMDILAELEEAVMVYEERARKEGVSLRYNEPPMLPLIYGDRNRLRQVFLNVIDNALKYTPSGGEVRVSAGMEGDGIRVVIADTGAGITSDDLPHVKERFYKAAHSRRGSGIGLAVADEIVSQHGGSLTLSSAAGKGTVVEIRLPVRVEGEAMGGGEASHVIEI